MTSGPYRHLEAGDGIDEERARDAFSRELMQDESFLWAGRPKQGVYFSILDLLLIPFAFIWSVLPIYAEAMVFSNRAPLLFGLLLSPFAAMGLYLTVGRFFVDARTRSRTFYCVTNRRVLIVAEGWTRTLTSIDLANSVEASLRERADGTGTISLGRRTAAASFADTSWPMAQSSGPPSLRRVAGARDVFMVIRDAQEAHRARP